MGKIALAASVGVVVLILAAASFVLVGSEAPTPQPMVKEVPYEFFSAQK